ncbi:hypothetical protein [Achromobacter aloeverae]
MRSDPIYQIVQRRLREKRIRATFGRVEVLAGLMSSDGQRFSRESLLHTLQAAGSAVTLVELVNSLKDLIRVGLVVRTRRGEYAAAAGGQPDADALEGIPVEIEAGGKVRDCDSLVSRRILAALLKRHGFPLPTKRVRIVAEAGARKRSGRGARS